MLYQVGLETNLFWCVVYFQIQNGLTTVPRFVHKQEEHIKAETIISISVRQCILLGMQKFFA